MLKLEFSTEAIEALRYWRFYHPYPQVQRKMEVVYLRSQGLGDEQIQRLCAISKATFYRYLRAVSSGWGGEAQGDELAPSGECFE